MANLSWIGLGKLGLTCALALEKHGGHQVTGYDPSPRAAQILNGTAPPPEEAGIEELLNGSRLQIVGSPTEAVAATAAASGVPISCSGVAAVRAIFPG